MKHAAPTALVIFGITGNLSRRKLLPALYFLERDGRLPEHFAIIGIWRDTPSLDLVLQDAEIAILRDHQDCDPAVMQRLKARIHPLQMQPTEPSRYSELKRLLSRLDREHGAKLNRLFYLAIPPAVFKPIIANLSACGLNQPGDGQASRILIEKPFGNDLASATDLISYMSDHFGEDQIYRIDHYLAKETAQNILKFRFQNPLIESIWSRQFIDHIQITAIEKIDIQGRIKFYEHMGALRDFIQPHLMQLVALIMMEYPEGLTAHAIHKEKLALLENIKPIASNHVDEVATRGQYAGYLEGVSNPHSRTETYAAVKLEVSNTRWGGVPVLLRTGKGMATKSTEIVIAFKDRQRHSAPDNLLVIRIQPDEGISFKLLAKKPGFQDDLQPVMMDFKYQRSFVDRQPDAYQRVLVDAMRGDQTLFATGAEVLASWRVLQPVLDVWRADPSQPEIYPPGSWGPKSADHLAGSYGVSWLTSPYYATEEKN